MASDGGASARTAAWRPAWTRASGGRVEAGGAGGRRHRRRRAADSDAIQSGGGDSAKTVRSGETIIPGIYSSIFFIFVCLDT
jgi:hypothetical protein